MTFVKFILALLLAVNCSAQFIPFIGHTAGATNVTLVKMLPEVTLTNGLISVWHLDESSGVRYDSWGTNHLYEAGGTIYPSNGVLNAASGCPGTSRLTNSSGAVLSPNDMTVSFWMYINTAGEPVWNGSASATRNWYIYFNNQLVIFSSGSSQVAFANEVFTSASTHHYVFTHNYAAKQTKLYIDGKYLDVQTHTVSKPASDYPFSIHSRHNASGALGWIDELAIWSRELTATEILYLSKSPNNWRYYLIRLR